MGLSHAAGQLRVCRQQASDLSRHHSQYQTVDFCHCAFAASGVRDNDIAVSESDEGAACPQVLHPTEWHFL